MHKGWKECSPVCAMLVPVFSLFVIAMELNCSMQLEDVKLIQVSDMLTLLALTVYRYVNSPYNIHTK